jgi:transposase
MLPAGEVRIYLACGVTDMRGGFHSLAARVQTVLQHDPYSGAIFIFRGRRGQHATFCIQFTVGEDRLSLAPAVWSYAPGIAVPARQGSEVHLHRRAA